MYDELIVLSWPKLMVINQSPSIRNQLYNVLDQINGD